MADESKQLDDVFKKLKQVQDEQARAAHNLSKAFDELGKTSGKILADQIKQAAKHYGVLNDEQIDLIKSHRDLGDALSQQEKKIEEEIAERKKNLAAMKAEAKQRDSLGVKISNVTDEQIKSIEAEISSREENLKAFKQETVAIENSIRKTNKFGLAVEGASSSIKGWVKDNLTFTKTIDLAKQATVQYIAELNKATSVGLQSAFATISFEALKLKMSFDELSEMISKNRDMVAHLGGGVKGVKEFSNVLGEASKGLSYMGKDGTIATARFFTTLKTMGASVKNTQRFNEAMKSTQRHFSEFSKLYGDSADQFADLIESQMQASTVQERLNSLNDREAAQLREEIITRTDNLKAMGLSNEKIKEFNQKISELYDPHKNNQSQKISDSMKFKTQVQMVSERTGKISSGSQAVLNQTANMVMNGATDDQIKQFMASNPDAFKEYSEGLAAMTKQQGAAFSRGDPSALMYQYATNQFGDNSLSQLASSFGNPVMIASQSGTRFTEEERARSRQQAAYMRQGLDDDGTSSSVLSAATSARDIQQQVEAATNSSVGKAGLAVASALGTAAVKAGVFEKVLDKVTNSKFFKKILGEGAELGAKEGLKIAGAAGAAGVAGSVLGKIGVKEGAQVAEKTVFKGLIKKLPILGLIAGAGFALERVANGEYDKAVLELASGAASMAPGLGTAASIAIDAGLAASDAGLIGTTASAPVPPPIVEPIPTPDTTNPSMWSPRMTNPSSSKFSGFGAEQDGYIAEAAKRYGIDEKVLRGFVKMEGGWTGKMSPTGAIGTGQFIQGTWNSLANSAEGQAIGMTRVDKSNFRTASDPRFNRRTNTLATGLLAKQNADILTRNGIPVTGENLYMLHNIGPGVIPALLGSNNVSSQTLLAMRQNGMMAGQTPTDFVSMQKGKFNTHYAMANNGLVTPSVTSSTPSSLASSVQYSDVKPPTASIPSPTPSTAVSQPSTSGNPTIEELKIQTGFLAQIASNTTQQLRGRGNMAMPGGVVSNGVG